MPDAVPEVRREVAEMKTTNPLTKGLILAVLAAVVLAAHPARVNADEIKLPVDDPTYGGGLINTTPSPGGDPRVTNDRDYGIGGRRNVDLGPANPLDQIKLPVRDDFGFLGWLWKIRLLLDVTPV